MLLPMTSFTLSRLTDATKHAESAETWQLGLQPEIMKLPGVAWAERWARPPSLATLAAGEDAALARAEYAELVLYHPPADASIRAHHEACERAAQLGHRPDLAYTETLLHCLFVPLKGYVNPHALVAPEVVPFRPARGLHAIVSQFRTHDAAAEAAFRWYDETRIPELLACRGAAGAWLLATESLFRPERDLSLPALRLVLVWLDGDPMDFAAGIPASRHDPSVETILFAGPLRTIVPFQWDWPGN